MTSLTQLLKEGDYQGALRSLIASADKASDANELLSLERKIDKIPADVFASLGFTPKKIAFLGGYTTSYFAPLVRVALLKSRIIATVFETDYGSFEHAIYSKNDKLKTFSPDACYFCVGEQHLSGDGLDTETKRWTSLWNETRNFLGCEIIQNTFEEPLHRVLGHYELKHPSSATNRIQDLNSRLAAEAPPFVHFNDVNFLASFHGRARWRDERLYDQAKVPVHYDYWAAYAQGVAAVCSAVFGQSKKCLVLDLDNTLWGGVVGDDGTANIQIGPDTDVGGAYFRFQSYVKRLKERGVILAVCSKNTEATAKEPFLKRREMPLKLEDISCFVANWEPKHENIVNIAKQLNIGLNSIVFIDDNPAERQIVRQFLPEVAVIEMPTDPSLFTLSLSQAHYFETVALTKEDLHRTEQYLSNQDRTELRERSGDYGAYLRGLEMKAAIAPFDSEHLPRISQLINKTNQFNLTTRRYSEADVRELAANPEIITRYVKLRDRFGDNGLISALIAKPSSDDRSRFEIDTWLMSCRVLNRQVECFLFEDLLVALRERGAKEVHGVYIRTPKNALVENLYPELGFLPLSSDSTTTRWVFSMQSDQERTPRPAIPIEHVSLSEYSDPKNKQEF